MLEDNTPPSEFLVALANGEAPLSGSMFGDANLAKLVSLTTDTDLRNRDWATFLLAQSAADTDAVRAAFLVAARDEDHMVRGEALRGLAKRDPAAAIPLIRSELSSDCAQVPVFEAAGLCGDPSLCPWPQPWRGRFLEPAFNRLVEDAFSACERSAPADL